MANCKYCTKDFESISELFGHEMSCTGDVLAESLNLSEVENAKDAGIRIAQALALLIKDHPDRNFQVVNVRNNESGLTRAAAIIGTKK